MLLENIQTKNLKILMKSFELEEEEDGQKEKNICSDDFIITLKKYINNELIERINNEWQRMDCFSKRINAL